MNRPDRPVRIAAALVGVASAIALAGCAQTTPEAGGAEPQTSTPQTSAPQTNETTGTGEGTGETDGASAYADGTYTATGSYQTPEGVEEIDVTIALSGGVVESVEVTGDPVRPQSREYQSRFIGGISDEVVGVPIDELNVTRVAGSSLTSGGFNEAVEQIMATAAE